MKKVPVFFPAIAGTFTGKTAEKGNNSGIFSGCSRNFYRKNNRRMRISGTNLDPVVRGICL